MAPASPPPVVLADVSTTTHVALLNGNRERVAPTPARMIYMRKCDLVMKGGITSGIVYPAAVCELARDFQFVNIGGTSAGAIAAALTAAAEYRRNAGSHAGFDELAALPQYLGERDGDRSRLFRLF